MKYERITNLVAGDGTFLFWFETTRLGRLLHHPITRPIFYRLWKLDAYVISPWVEKRLEAKATSE
jgi:hypothetical protein